MGLQRVGHDWATRRLIAFLRSFFLSIADWLNWWELKHQEFLDRAVSNNPPFLSPSPPQSLDRRAVPKERPKGRPGPWGIACVCFPFALGCLWFFFFEPFTFYLFIIFLVSGFALAVKSEGCSSGSVQAARAVASPAAEPGSGPAGVRSCGSRLQSTGSTAVPRGLSCSLAVGSSWTRDRTCVSCIGRQILYHCSMREASRRSQSSSLSPFFPSATFTSYPNSWHWKCIWQLKLSEEFLSFYTTYNLSFLFTGRVP